MEGKMAGRHVRSFVLALVLVIFAVAIAQRIDRLGAFLTAPTETLSVQAQEAPEPVTAARSGTEGDTTEGGTAAETAPASSSAQPVADGLPSRSLSRSERDLVADLEERRRALEEREAQLALKEQVLAATERRIKAEIQRLEEIKTEIAALVQSYNTAEDKKLSSLVKVYESMKPKDAAPIFQRLDLDIQERLARQMKAAKMAALLANMDPEAAKQLTSRLAQARKLPDAEQLLARRTQ